MKKKIIISENQYKRIFLNEQPSTKTVEVIWEGKTYSVKENISCYYMACDRGNTKLKKCYSSSDSLPYWFTLKNPLGDGYDYQKRIFDDCTRKWIRRSTKYRNEGPDLYSEHTDMSFGQNGGDLFITPNYEYDAKLGRSVPAKSTPKYQVELFNKLENKTKTYVGTQQKSESEYDYRNDYNRQKKWMESNGWVIVDFGGDNPKLADIHKSWNMSALETIRKIVSTDYKGNPRFSALNKGNDCLTIKTKDIGVYSVDVAERFQKRIEDIAKNPALNVVGGGYGKVPDYYIED
jgi:hypothetical protein